MALTVLHVPCSLDSGSDMAARIQAHDTLMTYADRNPSQPVGNAGGADLAEKGVGSHVQNLRKMLHGPLPPPPPPSLLLTTVIG